jgi:hypothetical protein
VNALIVGCSSSIRRSDASTNSRADTSPERTSAASSVADRRSSSDTAGKATPGGSVTTLWP